LHKTYARVAPTFVEAGPTSGPTDPAELESFLDSIIEPQLKDAPVAGVTLSVVRDGKVFLTKGYGYADVARSIPVRPESTLFRIGSITKLFTWTAVMQLVEQGKLDLEADVNTYLDFKIPATFPEPITLKHLMGHSAGFEDISLGQFPSRLDQVQPLGIWLARHIPARVRPPGVISAYSNYGADLAGYIVERVSGLPYQEYVEKNLFHPLGMERTTLQQPPPPELASDISVGHSYVNGAFQLQEFQWLRAQPEAAISATASDMARFMIAHLQDGRYGDTRILRDQTARQMHSTLFRIDERVNGFAYGFFERSTNGQRVVGHAGSTLIFNSDLVLLPDQNLGLFVSYNTYGAETLIDQLIMSFMSHYYPVAQEPPAPPADSASRALAFAGSTD
jgi:CubicO group peptidase (beta-lactamase class C family)